MPFNILRPTDNLARAYFLGPVLLNDARTGDRKYMHFVILFLIYENKSCQLTS